jgi:argininosuccinate lyase
MLAERGIITAEDRDALLVGLEQVARELGPNGDFRFDPQDEDIHMAIERRLTEIVGPVGGRLHTARSRNDQVVTDLAMYTRARASETQGAITALMATLLERAEEHIDWPMPGYTHLQRAQPVFLAHHFLAYVEMIERDKERLADAHRRINRMPLGSGAIAGSTIPVDRAYVAEILDFPEVTRNSMDAVSDRDFVAEMLFVLALTGIHLSRLSEDLILFASSEFKFVKISDGYSTGSSLMPQKKNPDVCELTRGKTGRLIGNLVTLLTVVKGLPMTYNRDLQEDKEAVFDSIDQTKLVWEVYSGMIRELEFDAGVMQQAASDPALLATDLADYLVLHGLPFRQAHEAIGGLVAYSQKQQRALPELSLEEFRRFSDRFEPDLYQVFQLDTAMTKRTAIGAPSAKNVAAELEAWDARLRE